MSATVFAGASQFAALELWGESIPYVSLALVALAVNARHMILGAALSPWINRLPWSRRLPILGLLSDVNFTDSQALYKEGERDAGVILGGGITLWATWVIGTAAGALLGNALGDLDRFGIDVLMIAFFAAITVRGVQSRTDIWPIVTAVVVTIATASLLPSGWNIIAAALAGGAVGVLTHGD